MKKKKKTNTLRLPVDCFQIVCGYNSTEVYFLGS